MGKYNGKSCRLITMLVLTTSFLMVEIIAGRVSNSLALIADAFHMLSDTMALVIGLLAVKYSKKGKSKTNTYGWARAEVVGALINAVFLVALCFTIFVEAIERLAMREPLENADLLLYVGGAGLLINLIGLCLFHNHAHGHTHGGAGHGHSHSHSHSHKDEPSKLHSDDEETADDLLDSDQKFHSFKDSQLQHKEDKRKVKSQQLNMRGVFLHMVGDALGSVVVMISAGLTMIYRKYIQPPLSSMPSDALNNTMSCDKVEMRRSLDPDWVLCIDPLLSLVLVAIILCTALPLLKHAAFVLMQSVPAHLDSNQLLREITQIKGVTEVHEFHIWSLSGNTVIASLHVGTKNLEDYVYIAGKVKKHLHNVGVHSVTIQPEFNELQMKPENRLCALECGPDMKCHSDTCCAKQDGHPKSVQRIISLDV